MAIRQKTRDAVMHLMSDGVPRTIRGVSNALYGRYNSTYAIALNLLANEGALTVSTPNDNSDARVFQMAASPAGAPTDNPFLWQSYKQYSPEVEA